MIFNFTHEQLLQAVDYGQQRSHASLHRRDNWGLDSSDKAEDSRRQTIGTLGEWAVSNYFGQEYFFTVNTFKAPDLFVNGIGIQVKASEFGVNFIIRPDAKDDEPYVYCRVEIPNEPFDAREYGLFPHLIARVEIVGWLYPWQGRLMAEMDPTLWRNPGGRTPAIFIPVSEILPLDKLREIVYNT